MKRVCLNRLKNEALTLSNLITTLDQLGSGLIQDVFDSIFKLCQQEKDSGVQTLLTASQRSDTLMQNSKRNTKEVLKMVVGLMIEDIWSNFDNYKL